MRDEVSRVLGHGGDLPTAARIRELMLIREGLTADEIRELLRALLAGPGQEEPLAGHATLFHEIANLLQRQPVRLTEFAEVLATVVRDEARSNVIRDYALQHLRRVWERASKEPRLRKSIEATLQEMVHLPGKLQPSVLLSLHLIDPKGKNGVDDTELRRAVAKALTDGGSGQSVQLKMAAARIAGERRIDDLREVLLRASSASSEHALVRMSAVSALGDIGDQSDLKALASLSPDDPRVAGAIRHALAGKSRP